MPPPLAGGLILLLLPLLVARLGFQRFVVRDTSMQPTLRPSDRALVGKWLRPGPGDLVVVRDPEQRSRFLVKRLAGFEPNGDVVLLADNPNVSRDSRHFGAVPPRLIVGRVVFRYLPADRRGWL